MLASLGLSKNNRSSSRTILDMTAQGTIAGIHEIQVVVLLR